MSATVSQLFRFPVKSMAGESHAALDFTERGVVGDRVWAVRDELRGGNIGVYARVVKGGVLKVGDSLEIRDQSAWFRFQQALLNKLSL